MPTTMQLITLFSACAGVFLWWKLPNIQRRELLKKYEEKVATGDIKELDLEKLADDYRKTVTQAITAALLLVSATVAFQQMENGRKELDRTQQNTQFANGFKLIASNEVYQRVGGVTALRDLAELSNDKYRSVIYAMTSFIMARTGGAHRLKGNCDDYIKTNRPSGKTSIAVSEDIQEALNVLLYRPKRMNIGIDLSGSGLAEANLEEMDFSSAHLAFVDFSGANLKNANFEHADLYCANFYGADLEGATFRNSKVDAALFIKANLDGAKFNDAILRGSNFSEIDFGNRSADFSGANLTGANFYRSNLANAEFDQRTELHEILDDHQASNSACFGEVENLPNSVKRASHWDGDMKIYTKKGQGLSNGPCHQYHQ